MENELIPKDESMVAVIQKHELGGIITPLIREIYLFDSYIAGTTHLEDKTVLDKIQIEDVLSLQREGDNKYDSNAIIVLNKEQKKLGYIPQKDNVVFSRLMDAGKILKARITDINFLKICRRGEKRKYHIS